MKKRALIVGITGQDGSYLSEQLLEKNYEVHGVIRRSSSFNTGRIIHLFQENGSEKQNFFLHYGDATDLSSMMALISNIKPDEIYNLSAQSHVKVSFETPIYTANVTAIGALNIFEICRQILPSVKIYQASSSEMFGGTPPPQTENSILAPRSPYAYGKCFAHHAAINYREAYGLHISSGILFNHESPRRGETFVTRKISKAVARISKGLQENLVLGNLDSSRDWGYAPEYTKAMISMLEQKNADDYVIATGRVATVRQFVDVAFKCVGLEYGKYVKQNKQYYRPSEVDALCGDASKAKRVLNWEPKTYWADLAKLMVAADLEFIENKDSNSSKNQNLENI